jgi:hypothetical protein
MIPKFRNRAIVLSILAAASTVAFFFTFRKSLMLGWEDWRWYAMLVYSVAVVLWMMASYQMARAKGCGPDELGRVILVSLVFAFFCPPAAFIFPFIGFFTPNRSGIQRRKRRRE